MFFRNADYGLKSMVSRKTKMEIKRFWGTLKCVS